MPMNCMALWIAEFVRVAIQKKRKEAQAMSSELRPVHWTNSECHIIFAHILP